MDVQRFLDRVRRQRWYQGQIVDDRSLLQRAAVQRQPRHDLHPELVQRLTDLGRWPPYAHQANAIDAAMAGENVVVATPTASGKSLCFQAPVLHDWLQNRRARALLLYPTKALAHDQLKALRELSPSGAAPKVDVYDGDTGKGEERAAVRRSVRVLLTNPDMLHMGILPNHKLWAPFFQNLRTVALDEAHYCRGVFGSHVSLVLRRLRRICARYGASPRFILCSATVGNPAELAQGLVGEPFHAVTENGAPQGEKRFLFWNPPLKQAGEHLMGNPMGPKDVPRGTAQSEAARLMAEAVLADVQAVAFVRSRRLAELVYAAARSQVKGADPRRAHLLAAYRGTYLPEDRRRVERKLKERSLLGVATTNALELGVDIGGLDATILTGYPGSVASAWQQAGRSGRRNEPSLAVLVAQDDPLDQYLMHHPEFFHGRAIEHALVAPGNPHILAPHLLCAAHEAPLTPGDQTFFGTTLQERVDELASDGKLRPHLGRWHLDPSVGYPAQFVELRSASESRYTVVDERNGAIMEKGIDEVFAFSHLHKGAIYLHHGEAYEVTDLKVKAEEALMRLADRGYYTEARSTTDIRLLEDLRSQPVSSGVAVALSRVKVTRQVVSFEKITYRDGKSLGVERLDLPAVEFETVALRFSIPKSAEGRKWDLAGGLHAVEHAAIGMLPLFALCDRADIGGVSTPLHTDTGAPAVFIYDGRPGGIGIAERGYQIIEDLWRTTLQAIEECPCKDGCPGCIQSPQCGTNNYPLDKGVAAALLRELLKKRRGLFGVLG